jgi:hypothetical protein
MKRIPTIAALVTAMSACGQSAPVATLQDQVVCSRQAQVVLNSAEDYGYFPSWDKANPPTVTNHFDPGTNKCFVMLEHVTLKNGEVTEDNVAVVNAFENHVVAHFDYFPNYNPSIPSAHPTILECWVHPPSAGPQICKTNDPTTGWVEPGLHYPAEHFDSLLRKYKMIE